MNSYRKTTLSANVVYPFCFPMFITEEASPAGGGKMVAVMLAGQKSTGHFSIPLKNRNTNLFAVCWLRVTGKIIAVNKLVRLT